ncbi:uncharacterized protein F5147DRAFT_670832 [Suillus discolor]|uniref:Uncharacterized protein n=1 Tax=Suillus discolor TaxID=1912936 RepID=A0A9P7FH94_9AGAM|nr:uncharacterized protein F5147DRAFT_670832 [Suillus discolor]KAG2117044.1 hypothetical protein F5147DRAFT_670832 [Suillus discolor]
MLKDYLDLLEVQRRHCLRRVSFGIPDFLLYLIFSLFVTTPRRFFFNTLRYVSRPIYVSILSSYISLWTRLLGTVNV